MRISIAILALTLMTAACATDGTQPIVTPTPAGGKDDDIKVSEVVGAVKRALQDTSQSMSGLPPLKSVTLTLSTSVEKETGGEFELIIKGGGSKTSSNTQEISIELGPPKTTETPVSGADLYESLKNALLAAARAARAARAAGGNTLALNGFSAEIGFEVSRASEGGLSFTVGPVSLGGTLKESRGTSHSINVSFEEKDS